MANKDEFNKNYYYLLLFSIKICAVIFIKKALKFQHARSYSKDLSSRFISMVIVTF